MKKFAAVAHNYRLLHENERKDLKNKNKKLQAWQKVAKWLWKSSFFLLFLKMSRTQKRFISFVPVYLVRLLRLRKQKKQQDLRMEPASCHVGRVVTENMEIANLSYLCSRIVLFIKVLSVFRHFCFLFITTVCVVFRKTSLFNIYFRCRWMHWGTISTQV